MRLEVAGKIADGIAWFDRLSFVSVMQHSPARHYDEDLFLEEMTMAAGGEVAGRHGLDHQSNSCATDVSTHVRHLSANRTVKTIVKRCNITDIYLTERHVTSLQISGGRVSRRGYATRVASRSISASRDGTEDSYLFAFGLLRHLVCAQGVARLKLPDLKRSLVALTDV